MKATKHHCLAVTYLVLMHAVIQMVLGSMELQVELLPLGCSLHLQHKMLSEMGTTHAS